MRASSHKHVKFDIQVHYGAVGKKSSVAAKILGAGNPACTGARYLDGRVRVGYNIVVGSSMAAGYGTGE